MAQPEYTSHITHVGNTTEQHKERLIASAALAESYARAIRLAVTQGHCAPNTVHKLSLVVLQINSGSALLWESQVMLERMKRWENSRRASAGNRQAAA
jgi:hypothetical protein